MLTHGGGVVMVFEVEVFRSDVQVRQSKNLNAESTDASAAVPAECGSAPLFHVFLTSY